MAGLEETISERYNQLKTIRTPYDDRAEQCAKLTLPYTFLDENHKAQDSLSRDYVQGFGAMLVNHLVGKLALTILPPSQPFFRLSATQEAMSKVSGDNEKARYEIEKILAEKEEGALREINKSDFRSSLYPALRLSVVTGNGIIEKINTDYKVHNLRNFVLQRDFAGKIIRLIIEEKLSYETIPEEFKSKVDEDKRDEEVAIYTNVQLIDGSYVLTQELLGESVGEEQTFKDFNEKFIDCSWNRIDGEDYARSFVEDHLGTLITLSKLTTVIYEGIAESVKLVKMVNPNGLTDYEDFVTAKHGQAIIGRAEDVTTVQSDKVQDLKVAKELINEMKQELSRAFLVTGASIRDSERTTAQEVAVVANEVESSLGGIYTRISGNIQRPTVLQALKNMKVSTGKDIDVIITTGLQALGRNVELSKINNLIQELQLLGQIVGPEAVAKVINVSSISGAMVANSGVASKNFLYSPEEMSTMEAEKQKQMMAQQALQGALPQAGQNAANQMIPQQGGGQ